MARTEPHSLRSPRSNAKLHSKMHVDVPLEMAKILLPDSQMSVLDFVEVVLPPVCEDTDQASYHVPSSEGGGQPWQSRCWRWRKTLVALVSWESGPRSILPCFIVL